MKRFIILFLLSAFSTFSISQSKYISGTIKDSKTKEAMPFCKVILKQDSIVSAFAVTDMKGYFELPSQQGEYKLFIKFIGYQTDSIAIEVEDENIFLGKIELIENSSTLNTVEVKGSIKDFDIDKDEYLLTDKMRSGTAKATDLLDKIDGVSYNRYSKAIKVDNESNVLLLVNGLQKSETFIKNINPKQISKIEVIRDPSGQYGLEGYTSVINIKLKKNYIGQELMISSNTIFDLKTNYSQNLIPMNNLGIDYNYTKKSFNFYTQAWTDYNHFNLTQNTIKEYDNGFSIEQTIPEDTKNFIIKTFSTGILAGADYQITPKHLVSIEADYNVTPETNISNSFLVKNKINNVLINQFNYQSIQSSNSKSFDGSVFYIGTFSKHKKLKIRYNNSNTITSTKSSFIVNNNSFGNINEGTDNTNSLNINWSHNLTKKFSYQLGTGSYVINNKIKNYIGFSSDYNDFKQKNYKNNIFAYATYRFSKTLSTKAGIAVENYISKSNIQTGNFMIYRPHFDLLYKPSKWINFKLKYRASSDYPTLSMLNPKELFIDNLSVQKGNPNLSPSTIHTYSFKTTAIQGLLSAEIYSKQSTNLISSIGNLRTDGIVEYNYENLGGYIKNGLKLNLIIPIGEILFWQNNANIFKSNITYQNNSNTVVDWSGESQLFYVNEKHNFVTGVMMQKSNIKMINPQGYSQGENDFWAFMIQKSFAKEKGSLMFLYMLPINYISDYTQDSQVKTLNYTQHSSTNFDLIKNVFMIEFSYRFQKGKEIKTIDRKKPKGGFL